MVMKKAIGTVILLIGIVFMIVGFSVEIPDRYINSWRMEEYVGGDAYNFIIEANLRGNEISAAENRKTVFISTGALMICVGLSVFAFSKREKTKEDLLDSEIDIKAAIREEKDLQAAEKEFRRMEKIEQKQIEKEQEKQIKEQSKSDSQKNI